MNRLVLGGSRLTGSRGRCLTGSCCLSLTSDRTGWGRDRRRTDLDGALEPHLNSSRWADEGFGQNGSAIGRISDGEHLRDAHGLSYGRTSGLLYDCQLPLAACRAVGRSTGWGRDREANAIGAEVELGVRASADRRARMDTGNASRRRFGLVTRVDVRITETTFPLVRAYPRGLLLAACSGPSPIATKPVRSATTTSTVPLASTTTVPATTTTTGPPTTTTASTMPATTTTVSSPTTILGYFQQSGTGSFNSQLFALPPNAWWPSGRTTVRAQVS